MTLTELRGEIKKGCSGGYLFYGREEYLRDFYIDRIRKTVLSEDETFSAFNHFIIKWGEDDETALENALGSIPMMAEKTLVEVSVNFSKLKKPEGLIEQLEGFDPENTVLIVVCPPDGIDAGKKNKPTAIFKALSSFLKPVLVDIQSYSELKKWIERRLSRENIAISDEGFNALVMRCGSEMLRLSGEADKLIAVCHARNVQIIEPPLVTEITAPTQEEDAFALANAVMNGDRAAALSQLAGCKRRQEKAPMVLGSVSKAICDMLAVSILLSDGAEKAAISKILKIHEFRVGLYISAVRDMEPARLRAAAQRCREADILMKTSRLDYIALERLICTIPAKSRAKRR